MLAMLGRPIAVLFVVLALVSVRSGATASAAPLDGALADVPETSLEQARSDAKLALRSRLGFDVPVQLDPASEPGAPVFSASLKLESAAEHRLAAAELIDPVTPQQSSWNCDWNPCDIWGVASQVVVGAPTNYWIDRINVCTGAVRIWL